MRELQDVSVLISARQTEALLRLIDIWKDVFVNHEDRDTLLAFAERLRIIHSIEV